MYKPNPADVGASSLSLGHHSYMHMVQTKYQEHAIQNGTNLARKQFKKITPMNFSVLEWVLAQKTHFVFEDANDGFLFYPWGHVMYAHRGRNFHLTVVTEDENQIEKWMRNQDTYGFREEGVTITWLHGPDWAHVNMEEVPVDPVEPIRGAYPWLNKSIEDYAADYMDSSASILILIGPPGTGKTSFIRSLLQYRGMNAAVTYEPRLLNEDGLFAYFIGNDDVDTLILEDADNYLGSRKDGNDMMHRFLNVSNGLISPLKGKKIIFSTNLPSTADVDAALMRPGRCYEVMNFRALTKDEAAKVAKEVYKDSAPVLTKDNYTLAEITNFNNIEQTKSRKSFGFLSR